MIASALYVLVGAEFFFVINIVYFAHPVAETMSMPAQNPVAFALGVLLWPLGAAQALHLFGLGFE
jgi:hypothetical protein